MSQVEKLVIIAVVEREVDLFHNYWFISNRTLHRSIGNHSVCPEI
ncbi:hypothetical protein T03_7572 [Trichinella britovi]|uniref:Uncharacterized protein n=1 Tax=Trichinella britovi TaxID=45882 RepID=A0A0V1B1P5_TRIBR|nr:hypothetical protein T03_7572 [Trichinella britovi]